MAKKKDDAAEGADGEAKKGGGLGGKLKLVALILPTVLLIAGAVYFFVLAPKSTAAGANAKASASASADASGDGSGDGSGDEAVPSSTYAPGKLLAVDPVTINLANGHFLKVGLALQFTADAGEEVAGSQSLDCLITEFSGKTVDELATQAGRDAAKKDLLKKIKKVYEKKVYEIYYTSFVMN
jgi:flagellar FliL protein